MTAHERLPRLRDSDIRLKMQCEFLVLGGGIVGSAVAYELTRRGTSNVHVVDVDLEGELSSTERNAGGVRHLWQHPVNVELARHTISLFKRYKEEVGFQEDGYLWLQSKEQAENGMQLLKQAQTNKTQYERLDLSDLRDRYAFLDKTDDLAFGIFGAEDGLINANAAKTFLRSEAKKRGAVFHDSLWATGVESRAAGVSVTFSRVKSKESAKETLSQPSLAIAGETQEWKASKVILALGAWVQELAPFEELRSLLQPVRRQISFFEAENFDFGQFGMVVDTSRVYFHPEGGRLLAGFVTANERPGYNFKYDSTFFEENIWPPLYERSTYFERLKHISGWAGLYSYTPDKSGVLGAVPGQPNVYEAHSFTGRGLMQSYGAALALCELILDGKFETFDASPLRRERFRSKTDWLVETLHI